MKEKKNSVITFRTEDWVKNQLQIAADQNQWSLAQTAETICKKFVANPQPGTIVIKLKNLEEIINQVKEGGYQAIKLNIDIVEENNELYKELDIIGLESGGWGACYDFDTIRGLTKLEILDIP